MSPERIICTVGHSNHPLEEFVEILRRHGVKVMADVRRFPGSRKWPQYNAEALARELPKFGLKYEPFPELGGRRKPDPASKNTGWRNESFRACADYVQTGEFLTGLDRLTELAAKERVAITCAEAVPWRCHRSLISDALLVRGWTVLDLMSATKATPHKLTPFAKVEGLHITYPPEEPSLFESTG